MIYFITLLLIVTSVALFISIKKNLHLTERLDDVGEQVEESLDVLDSCYARISKTLATPLASDEPEIRALLSDIGDCHLAILHVANKLVAFDEINENNE